MLVSLGKLHDGEEKSKEGDIDIGVHDEDGALYVMEKLPLTSYPKMVDYWLIFCQLVPFVEVSFPLNQKLFIANFVSVGDITHYYGIPKGGKKGEKGEEKRK